MVKIAGILVLFLMSSQTTGQTVNHTEYSIKSLLFDGTLTLPPNSTNEILTGISSIELQYHGIEAVKELLLVGRGFWTAENVFQNEAPIEFQFFPNPKISGETQKVTLFHLIPASPLETGDVLKLSIHFKSYPRPTTSIVKQQNEPMANYTEIKIFEEFEDFFPLPHLVEKTGVTPNYEIGAADFDFQLTAPEHMRASISNRNNNNFSEIAENSKSLSEDRQTISTLFSYYSSTLSRRPKLMFYCDISDCRGPRVLERLSKSQE